MKSFIQSTNQACGVFCEYDFGFKDQFCFTDLFQKAMQRPLTVCKVSFSESDVQEIIARCRLLRSLEFWDAVMMIGAAESVCDEFILKCQPKALIAPRIDTYLLDILERKLLLANIPYIGVWRSAFVKNRFFLTNRGEHCIACTSNTTEIHDFIQSVGSFEFRATSLSNNKYSTRSLYAAHGKRMVRDVCLESLRRVHSFKFGYREMATGFHVNDYRVPPTTWKGDFQNLSASKKILSDLRPRVFVALQVNPESTIDYYSRNIDLIDIPKTLVKVVTTCLNNGFQVVIKDHPNMFGRRNYQFINKLCKLKEVYLLDNNLPSTEIVTSCDVVFTWSGTIAVQAFFAGIPSISVCSPFGLQLPGYNIVNSTVEIATVLKHLKMGESKNAIQESDKIKLAQHILNAHLEGEVFTHDKRQPNVIKFVEWIDANIEKISVRNGKIRLNLF